MGLQAVSFVERFIVLCPYFEESAIKGSNRAKQHTFLISYDYPLYLLACLYLSFHVTFPLSYPIPPPLLFFSFEAASHVDGRPSATHSTHHHYYATMTLYFTWL